MITVFTPVYNRAYTIVQLYQSLMRQTSYDFEWLLIDDGSTDNIAKLVKRWIEYTKQFEIRFYQQENGGKHRAINRGVQLAEGSAFLIVDSDDYLTDDAIETASKYWKQIENDRQFAGISGLRIHRDGQVIGDSPQFKEYVDATNLERAKYGLGGDKAEVYKTYILKKFPFPEFDDENFVTEAVVWNKIAHQGYKIRWFNKGIVVCDYLPDGLTAKGQQLFWDNPKGWAYHLHIQKECGVNEYSSWLRECYRWYERECIKFTAREIKTMLGLTDTEFHIIVDQYNQFTQKLLEICIGKRVCIYAFGKWGKRLKWYLDCLEVQVSYVIDRQFDNIKEIRAYSIEMDLPQVDVVFVALNKGAECVFKTLKSKMPEADIVLCERLKPALW